MPLTITTEPGQGFVTIRPAGALDSNTSPSLEEHVGGIMARRPRALVFDLKDLHYISSAGIRVIVATQKAMKAAGGEMVLTNLQPQIRKVFEIIMVMPSLRVLEDVAELDRYLDGVQKKVLGDGNA